MAHTAPLGLLVLTSLLYGQVETGNPYMLYKDTCNRKSNQQNLGTIRCSNLCTEIMEYTSPDETAVCNLASIALPRFVRDRRTNGAERVKLVGSLQAPHRSALLESSLLVCTRSNATSSNNGEQEHIWKLRDHSGQYSGCCVGSALSGGLQMLLTDVLLINKQRSGEISMALCLHERSSPPSRCDPMATLS